MIKLTILLFISAFFLVFCEEEKRTISTASSYANRYLKGGKGTSYSDSLVVGELKLSIFKLEFLQAGGDPVSFPGPFVLDFITNKFNPPLPSTLFNGESYDQVKISLYQSKNEQEEHLQYRSLFIGGNFKNSQQQKVPFQIALVRPVRIVAKSEEGFLLNETVGQKIINLFNFEEWLSAIDFNAGEVENNEVIINYLTNKALHSSFIEKVTSELNFDKRQKEAAAQNNNSNLNRGEQSEGLKWLYMVSIDPEAKEALIDIDGIDVNDDKETVITGFYQGKILFGDEVAFESTKYASSDYYTKDLYWAKYGAEGKLQKKGVFASTGWAGNGFDIAIDDGTNDIYISGGFSKEITFSDSTKLSSRCDQGKGLGSNSGTQGQMFLVKLDEEGKVKWAGQAQSDSIISGGNEVSIDPQGDILQIGLYGWTRSEDYEKDSCLKQGSESQIEIQGHTLTYDGGHHDTYVAAFKKEDGTLLYPPIKIGGIGRQRGKAVDWSAPHEGKKTLVIGVDSTGDSEISYESKVLESYSSYKFAEPDEAYNRSMLVAKLTYDGELLWHHVLATESTPLLKGKVVVADNEIKGVATDSEGNVWAAGTIFGAMTIDGEKAVDPLDISKNTAAGGYVAKFDGQDGKLMTVKVFGVEGQGDKKTAVLACCELVIDKQDRVYITPTIRGGTLFNYNNEYRVQLEPKAIEEKMGLLLRIDSEGEILNVRSLLHQDGATFTSTDELAVAGNSAFPSGVIDGSVKFDGVQSSIAGGKDGSEFVARFDFD